MLSAREAMEQIAFPDVLDKQELPVTLEVSVDCKLYEKTVLEQGQRLTVIDRANLDVLGGRDWNNKKVRIGKEQIADYQLDIVEEMYPKSIEELSTMVEKSNYIQAKTEFRNDLLHFEPFQTFQFAKFLDDAKESVVVQTSQGLTILDSNILLDPKCFVLVQIKDVTTVKDFVRKFNAEQPTTVCFRSMSTGIILPLGNVLIKSIRNFEIAYTVTAINEELELKYETFPIDKRILFRNTRLQKLPKYVQVLGAYNSNGYREKLDEIKAVMNYEYQSPRFYAFLVIENHTYTLTNARESATFQRPAQLDLKSNFYSSFKKGFSKFTKRTPSNEDLSNKQKLSKSLSGFYKPSGNKQTENNSPQKSELAAEPTKTLQSTENLVYNIDTLVLNELKNKKDLSVSPPRVSTPPAPVINQQNDQQRKQMKPSRPVSFDNSILFPIDPDTSSEDIYEAPFSQLSPYGPPRHIKNENITIVRRSRSPSLPLRSTLRPFRNPFTNSQSVSPPRIPILPFPEQDGLDSGVDSPDESKQLIREFQEANKQGTQIRSDSSSSELEISLPFNCRHLTKRITFSETGPLYDIPKRTLHESMNFPRRMELKRCRSESALDEEAPVYAEPNYDDIKGIPRAEINARQRAELQSISQIKSYNIQQIVQLLNSLNFKKFVLPFKSEMVNGVVLSTLTEKMLISDLGMSAFEARKLYKYVHGWRPIANAKNAKSSSDEIRSMDRNEWGYIDVKNQLKSIKLQDFGNFCCENLIDGTMLLDLLYQDLIPSLKNDGIMLKEVEMKRLTLFLNRKGLYEQDKEFLESNLSLKLES